MRAQVVREILKSLVNLCGVLLPLSHQRSELHRQSALPGAADGRQVALKTLEVAVDVGAVNSTRRETLPGRLLALWCMNCLYGLSRRDA